MVEVTLWAGLRPLVGDQEKLTVEAKTIRELFRKLEVLYPALREPIKNQIAVSIDGVIYRDDWSQPLPEGSEVFLMQRLEGG